MQYRIAGSLVTSTGSVTRRRPAATASSTSALSYARLRTTRSSSSAAASQPASPRCVRDRTRTSACRFRCRDSQHSQVLGHLARDDDSNISIDLFPRSGATQTGPYFTFNPTRCTPANSRAVLTSYKGVVFTKAASFTATNCDAPRFDPTFSLTADNTPPGKPRVSAPQSQCRRPTKRHSSRTFANRRHAPGRRDSRHECGQRDHDALFRNAVRFGHLPRRFADRHREGQRAVPADRNDRRDLPDEQDRLQVRLHPARRTRNHRDASRISPRRLRLAPADCAPRS